MKQWTAARYVIYHKDPYALALKALRILHGTELNTSMNIWSIPTEAPETLKPELIQGLPVPDTTYPPHTIGLIALTLGQIGNVDVANAVMCVLNILSVFVLYLMLRSLVPPGPGVSQLPEKVILLLCLFAPTYQTVHSGQFSTLVLIGLLYSYRNPDSPLASGAMLFLALLKPSITLAFLALYLDNRRYKTLLVACGLVAALTVVTSAMAGTDPLTLIREWLGASAYFIPGKHWTTKSGLLLKYNMLVVLAYLAAFYVLTLAAKRTSELFAFAMAGVLSTIYTYHSSYDFVACLPFFMILVHPALFPEHLDTPLKRNTALAVAACAFVLQSYLVFWTQRTFLESFASHGAFLLPGSFRFYANLLALNVPALMLACFTVLTFLRQRTRPSLK
ncbi:MAG: glycosyltransferase 87 family protein [Acidobacteriota bacterium]